MQSCLSHEIAAHKVWHYTRSNLAFNPYQDITASGVKPDLAFTLSQMSYCRQVLAAMCVLANHSISSTRITDASYSKIYDQMKAAGPPLDLQTATAAKIGNWSTVLSYAVSMGVNNVELPSGYTTWSSSTLASDDQQLRANPVDSGSSGGGAGTPSPSTSPTASPSSGRRRHRPRRRHPPLHPARSRRRSSSGRRTTRTTRSTATPGCRT